MRSKSGERKMSRRLLVVLFLAIAALPFKATAGEAPPWGLYCGEFDTDGKEWCRLYPNHVVINGVPKGCVQIAPRMQVVCSKKPQTLVTQNIPWSWYGKIPAQALALNARFRQYIDTSQNEGR